MHPDVETRQKSDGVPYSGLEMDEEPYENHGIYVENEESGLGPVSGLVRGDMASGRSSPVKARERSRPPNQWPLSTPTLATLHHESQVNNLSKSEDRVYEVEAIGDMDDQYEVEEDHKRPDTPTPVSRSQQRTAYVPLGAPASFFKREEKGVLERLHARAQHPTEIFGTMAANGPTPLAPQNPSLAVKSDTPSSRHPAYSVPSFPISPQAINKAVPRKPIPLPGPDKHVRVSAQSNLSGGTVASKRSIFNTPGRDELERKKALVEPDEGPFARATTVADLRERRRRISEGTVEEKKKGKICGLGCSYCNVM